MSRELTKKEREWVMELKRVLGKVPKTLFVLQSNETNQLMLFDRYSGESIDHPDVQGCLEGDPLEKVTFKEDGTFAGWE